MRRFLRPMGSSVLWCFLARWWIGSYEKGEAGRGKREEYNKPGTALTLPPSRVPLPQGSSAAPETLPHAQPPWPLAPPPPSSPSPPRGTDRKSTRLNPSHAHTSYAVFLFKKKIKIHD